MIKVRRENESLARDVVIPFSFFQKELMTLDETSLRCYLFLVAQAQHGTSEVDESEMSERFSVSAKALVDVLKYLERQQLIVLSREGIEVCDLRRVHQAQFENGPEVECEIPRVQQAQISEQEGIIRQINDTFYSGVMPLPFYRAIERWFKEYFFEGAVIYALFNELKHYGTLNSDTYAERIASNWASRNIRTFQDLSDYYEERNSYKKAATVIQKRLRQAQPLSRYQLDYLERWMDTWQLSLEIVDEAFRRASMKSQHNNFNYVEGILKNWYEAGVNTPEEIIEYEEQHRKEYAKLNAGKPKQKKHSAMSNFPQRDYSEEAFSDYYRSLDFLDDSAPASNTEGEQGE